MDVSLSFREDDFIKLLPRPGRWIDVTDMIAAAPKKYPDPPVFPTPSLSVFLFALNRGYFKDSVALRAPGHAGSVVPLGSG